MNLLLCQILLTFVFIIKYIAANQGELNDRPIIAILAQDAPPYYNRSYIAASYVKYLESSGARVVPVPSHMSDEEVEEIFRGVNGVLYPGGGVKWSVSGYYKHAKYFFARAIEANKNNDYFPIWGTCLGFETLNIIAAGNNTSVLSRFSASDISLPLNYTDAAPTSRMFNGISENLYKAIGSEGITYNHHNYGVGIDTYNKEPSLKDFFKILSVNNGLNGKTFVSTVEAFDYPIYGTQWHPEKNNFEYNTEENIPHSETAIQASLYMSNFFVNEARKNHHQFESKEREQSLLIYNYNPEYTGKGSDLPHFEQSYFFNDRS